MYIHGIRPFRPKLWWMIGWDIILETIVTDLIYA
jgi:hypothetical protein